MALLRVFPEIENDVYKLTFVNDPAKLSEADKTLMRQFGEPEIDMGGTYLAESENTFILPAKLIKVRSDFPFTQEFDSRDAAFLTNTQTKVEAYRDAIIVKFTNAFTTLRTNTDTFTGERTYSI